MMKRLKSMKERALGILLRRRAREHNLANPGVAKLAKERGISYAQAERLAQENGLHADPTSSWSMIKNRVPKKTQREILNLKAMKKEAEDEK